MTEELSGSVALVTGGAAGIGRAAALAFAKQGASVAIADLKVDRGNDLVDEIESFGGEAIFVEKEKQFVDLEPIGRMGTPEEIAAAAVWLCSPAASFVTGHAMSVDGGLVAQ